MYANSVEPHQLRDAAFPLLAQALNGWESLGVGSTLLPCWNMAKVREILGRGDPRANQGIRPDAGVEISLSVLELS